MNINVGVSNHHVHLNVNDMELLFGPGYQLKHLKDLTQLGQYACCEKVTLKTLKATIEGVRVLGPVRPYTQVEISKTDAYALGLNPPVRDSGDLVDSSPIKIIGPYGSVNLNYGCIIANRHIHLNKQDLNRLGLNVDDIVQVKLDGPKGGIIDNVCLKVDDSYTFELHLDTDDANAHLLKQGDVGSIIK